MYLPALRKYTFRTIVCIIVYGKRLVSFSNDAILSSVKSKNNNELPVKLPMKKIVSLPYYLNYQQDKFDGPNIIIHS